MNLPDCLQQPCILVLLDAPAEGVQAEVRVGELIPAVEVMVQEGLRTFSLSITDAAVWGEVREIFGDRAEFGIHDVDTTEQVLAAIDLAPAFILASSADREVVRLGLGAGVATLPGALTPNEIRSAWKLGVPAVQVMPADLFGSSYPDQLRVLVPDLVMVPRGGLGAWSMGRWFEAGAAVCVADTSLVGDALAGGNLSHLRDRVRSFIAAVPEAAD